MKGHYISWYRLLIDFLIALGITLATKLDCWCELKNLSGANADFIFGYTLQMLIIILIIDLMWTKLIKLIIRRMKQKKGIKNENLK